MRGITDRIASFVESLAARTADAGGEGDPDTDPGGPSPLELARSIAGRPLTTTLPDGRRLGYADCGDPGGDPLVVFHGFPNSRVFGALFDRPGRRRGIRVLAPERPGIGVSDPDPGRSLGDWPADVAALLDDLGIDSAPVLGVSGGGPYALACAALTPDRVDRAGVAAGLAPPDAAGLRRRATYRLLRHATPVTRLSLWRDGRRAREDPAAYLEERAAAAADVDADHWRGEVGRVLLASGLEARRHHGNAGLARELALYASPWDFDPGSIDVDTYLWYGKADRIVPAGMGRELDRRVPAAESHFHPGLGHVSVVERNRERIVRTLLGR